MARKFLYLFAVLIVIVIAAAVAYRLFPQTVMRMALVPSTRFEELAPGAKGYDDPSMWIARPGMAAAGAQQFEGNVGAKAGNHRARTSGSHSAIAGNRIRSRRWTRSEARNGATPLKMRPMLTSRAMPWMT